MWRSVLIEVSRFEFDYAKNANWHAFAVMSSVWCSAIYSNQRLFQVAHTCLDILRKPLMIAEHRYSISASIGPDLYLPEHGTEPNTQKNAEFSPCPCQIHGKNGLSIVHSGIMQIFRAARVNG